MGIARVGRNGDASAAPNAARAVAGDRGAHAGRKTRGKHTTWESEILFRVCGKFQIVSTPKFFFFF